MPPTGATWQHKVTIIIHNNLDNGIQAVSYTHLPRHNTVDAATLYWAGMPGNAGDFPAEESFYTFIEPAVCFLSLIHI